MMVMDEQEAARKALALWAAVPRSSYVAAAWRAGERNVSELARLAGVGRDTIYADLRDEGIDYRAELRPRVELPQLTAEERAAVVGFKQELMGQLAMELPPFSGVRFWVVAYQVERSTVEGGVEFRPCTIVVPSSADAEIADVVKAVSSWLVWWGNVLRFFGPYATLAEAERVRADPRLWEMLPDRSDWRYQGAEYADGLMPAEGEAHGGIDVDGR